jgi:hypothetical protein
MISNSFYKQVEPGEFEFTSFSPIAPENMAVNTLTDIDQKYIDILSKSISDEYFFGNDDMDGIRFFKIMRSPRYDKESNIDKSHSSKIGDGNLMVIDIYECSDEWFYIKRQTKNYVISYYKCDQFEGVIEYLKDDGVIK